jgi:hypothetical protein
MAHRSGCGSLLAALAHGLAVVTTFEANDQGRKTNEDDARRFGRSPSVLRPFADGETCLLCRRGMRQRWPLQSSGCASDTRAARRTCSRAGRALAAQFGWDTIAAQHGQLYAHLIRR